MSLTKSDLISRMASEASITKAAAEAALNGALEAMGEALALKGKVLIAGFGIFDVTHRNARAGRNPRTGEALQIPASNSVRFKAGKRLAERVNP
ncbi:MAG: HU family DNA-binding protein [Deferrisomatales bacterium]|nr:HU family DNA-binding protein [Deferrisomatales bacterium]